MTFCNEKKVMRSADFHRLSKVRVMTQQIAWPAGHEKACSSARKEALKAGEASYSVEIDGRARTFWMTVGKAPLVVPH